MKKKLCLFFYLLFSLSAIAQSQIKGRVYDIYRLTPLAGVSVIFPNNVGTITDKNGEFTLDCTGDLQLTLRIVGYETYTSMVKDCNRTLQIGMTPSNSSLNEVQIYGANSGNKAVLTQPQSIGLLSRREITRNDLVFPENYLNLLPGVRMEKRTASGGQRILIRGYGYPAGSGNPVNFNGSGIKAYLNGIPLTDAEGVTIFDDVDYSTLGNIEVIKGPASSIYGTGIGGVVNMFTMKPATQTTQVVQEAIGGSYGLFRTNTRLETANDKASISINYGNQNYDGYRVHTKSNRDFVSFLGDFRSSDRQSFSAYAAYNNTYDAMAGQLDSASFFNKENKGEAAYLINNGHVGFESFRTGLSHKYAFSRTVSNSTALFTSNYQQSQASAAGLNSNFYRNVGGRSVFNLSFPGKIVSLFGTVGAEYQKTSSFRKTNALVNGALSGITTDLEVASTQHSIFTEWNLDLPADFTFIAGMSSNQIEYGIVDKLANVATPTHRDQSGYKVFKPVLTPRLALQKVFNQSITTYVSLSKGYAPPTSGNVIVPYTGTVLTDLKPERAIQYEIGSKGNLLNKKLSYQIALFDLRVNDKLSSQAAMGDAGTILYSYSVNAGSQSNKGIEVALNYSLIRDNTGFVNNLRPFINYTFSNFRYETFKSNNNNNAATIDYSNNRVMGVPEINFNAGVDLDTKLGLYLLTTYQYVGKVPISFDNAHYAPSYSLLNVKLGYHKTLSNHINIDVFAGANNITNSLYYHMVFLSAYTATNNNPAIYLPAAYHSTFFGGLTFTYKF